MTLREQCPFCSAPWMDQFTKHRPECPSFISLVPTDPRIFRGTPSQFFEKAAQLLERKEGEK